MSYVDLHEVHVCSTFLYTTIIAHDADVGFYFLLYTNAEIIILMHAEHIPD